MKKAKKAMEYEDSTKLYNKNTKKKVTMKNTNRNIDDMNTANILWAVAFRHRTILLVTFIVVENAYYFVKHFGLA